jgi:hypothetical protein
MAGPHRPLGAKDFHQLFLEVSDELAQAGESAAVFLVGGAAMALAYSTTRTTEDADGLFVNPQAVRIAAQRVAERRGNLPVDWLNDAAKGFMPGPDDHPVQVFITDSLEVQVASVEYLLAMKLFSGRTGRDWDDAAVLYNLAGYTTVQEGLDLLASKFPAWTLEPSHRDFTESVASEAALRRQQDTQ